MIKILLALALTASASAQIAGPGFAFWKTTSTVWTPLAIDSCIMWLDPSDSTTITHASQRISSMRDKSPYMHDATQSTSGKQPYLLYNAIGGLPAGSYFIARTDVLQADSVAYKSHALTAFVVALMTSTTDAYGRALSISTASAQDYDAADRAAIFLRNNGAQNIGAYRTAMKSNRNVTYSTAFQATSIFDGTNHTMRVDGTASASVSSTGLFNVASPTGVITVGNSTSANGSWQGYIGEVIVYKRALTPTEITTVETYLKAKWGTP